MAKKSVWYFSYNYVLVLKEIALKIATLARLKYKLLMMVTDRNM